MLIIGVNIKHLRNILMVLALLTVPAYAGGGNVLPPKANPKGYWLSEIAEATAFFNTNPNRSEAIEPAVPFQILYVSATNPSNTFFVRPGTMLYVPILYVDDSPPIIGDFPTDVTDHAAVVYYYYAHEQLGTEYIEVEVDGKVTQLGPKYVVGVETPPLPDGGGTNYIPAAVFLTPLTKGTHTVKIRARLTGLALVPFFGPDPVYEFEVPYTVIVR